MPIQCDARNFALNPRGQRGAGARLVLYMQGSVFKQSIYTALRARGGVLAKSAVPGDILNALWNEAEQTGLFRPAGRELRCTIDRQFSEEEMGALLAWCGKVAAFIKKHGLRE